MHDPTPDPSRWPHNRSTIASAEIYAQVVYSLTSPSLPPGMHDYDPMRHNLTEGVSKCMISKEEAKVNEYCETRVSHDEVYTDGSKMKEREATVAVINHHFQNGETTWYLYKNGHTTAPPLLLRLQPSLNYYRHMGQLHHDVVVYSGPMCYMQSIEGKDTEKPPTCRIMILLWLLSGKGTHKNFC